jgi:hypothetical protein
MMIPSKNAQWLRKNNKNCNMLDFYQIYVAIEDFS